MTWKVIKDYPNYVINKDGIILSSKRGFRELAAYKCRDGYLHVSLSNLGIRKRHSIHRLVAKNFLLKYNPNENVVNHKNSIRDDNHVKNLEWTTVEGNNLHGLLFGRISQPGESNANRKLNNKKVLEIKERLKKGEMYIDIAPSYNVTSTTIGRIARGENWSHIEG